MNLIILPSKLYRNPKERKIEFLPSRDMRFIQEQRIIEINIKLLTYT